MPEANCERAFINAVKMEAMNQTGRQLVTVFVRSCGEFLGGWCFGAGRLWRLQWNCQLRVLFTLTYYPVALF